MFNFICSCQNRIWLEVSSAVFHSYNEVAMYCQFVNAWKECLWDLGDIYVTGLDIEY